MRQVIRLLVVIHATLMSLTTTVFGRDASPNQVVETMEDGAVDISCYDFRGLRIELKQSDAAGKVIYWEKSLYNQNGLRVAIIVLKEDGTPDRIYSITYDHNRYPTALYEFHGNGQLSRANQYRYNEAGKLVGGELTIISVDGKNVRHSTNVDSVKAFMPTLPNGEKH